MRERNYQMCRLLLLTDVIGDGGCRFWQPVQADSQPKSSGLVMCRRPLGAVLHSSNEPGELSQWLCHDDSTINIVLDIIIYYYSLFGHICRLPENTPASQALQLSIEAHTGTPPAADWKCLPGRPRRNWLQQLEEYTGLSVGAAWIAGQDRSMWRTLRPSAGQAQQ